MIAFPSSGERAVFDSLRHELSKTIAIAEQIPLEIQLAHHYIYINKDSLHRYASQAINHSKEINDYGYLWRAYLKYSMYFNGFPESKNDNLAFAYIDSARLVAKDHNMALGVATCYFHSGFLKVELNKDQEAITDLAKAKAMFEELGHSGAILQVSYQIGYLYLKTGNPQETIAIFKTIKNSPQLKSSYLYRGFLEYFGSAYQSIGDYESALAQYQKCYALIQKEGDNCDKNRILIKLTTAYSKLGVKDSTQFYFTKSVSYIDSCQQNEALDNNFRPLAEVCVDEKRYQEAEYYYQKSLEVVRRNEWSSSELETLKGLADLHERQGNFHKAYQYYQEYAQLKDSLKLLGLDQVLTRVMSDEELNSKSGEFAQLIAERKTMVKKIVILSFFAIVTAMLFFVFWFFQGKMLFHFCQNGLENEKRSSKDANFYHFSIPIEPLGTPFMLFTASLFAVLISLSSTFILNFQSSPIKLVTWALISFMVYFISHWPYNRYISKDKEISFSKVLIWRLVLIIINNALLTETALMLHFIAPIPDDIIMVSLTLISGQFILNTLELLVKYRNSFNMVKNRMMDNFNLMLAEKKLQQNKNKEEDISFEKNAKTVSIDNTEINLKNVMYISSENIYQEFVHHINNSESKLLIRSTMKAIENKLENHPEFVRCHRSFIINTNYIDTITGNSKQQYLTLSVSNKKIPISRSLDMQIIKQLEDVLMQQHY
ncbi:tetratricopeptide repeat protein [Marinilabilia sp.]|uniref:tetratricopeptide repeat protein n=1 Tax=Marinilabilia sp. TaxID=2021252 RepID=UPI0025C12E5A|nr:tetratricopeptide repeat protein [Marinilabilia sp.]